MLFKPLLHPSDALDISAWELGLHTFTAAGRCVCKFCVT